VGQDGLKRLKQQLHQEHSQLHKWHQQLLLLKHEQNAQQKEQGKLIHIEHRLSKVL